MIHSKDRSGYIGASDTSFVVGNWNTKTWKKWWLEKLGLSRNELNTKAMKCGNAFEGKILDTIGCNKDLQIIIEDLRLRVNLDGNTKDTIYEVKTFRDDKVFKISKPYWRQSQVEMFAFKQKYGILPNLFITAYPLSEHEYRNYFVDIDKDKLQFLPVEYDEDFISDYIMKLKILKKCMDVGTMPKTGENK